MVAVGLDPGFSSILEKLPDAVLLADDERRYVFANGAAATLLDTLPEQLIGMRIDDFAFETTVQEDWRDFIAEGKQRGPFRLRSLIGAIKYVHFNAVANIYPGVHLSILRDVTAEHEAELRQAQVRHLSELALKAAQMGCWHWSMLTQRTSCNSAFQQLFDLPSDGSDPTYEDFLARVHPEDLPGLRNLLSETLQEGERYEFQYRVICRDGSTRWLIDRGEVLFDGDGRRIGISGVAWDVTKQRALEQEHANHARELARSNLDLQRFAHVASHDLKEPLRNVCALSELLARQSENKLDDDELEVLQMIVGSAKRMATLIDSMLAYAKTGLKREVTFHKVSARQIVEDALANLRLTIEQTGAAVDIGELPVISCSRSDIAQVFQNLIGNAIKYCAGAPLVKITAKNDGDAWAFAVKDNGIGIEPERHQDIFEMFTRLHGDTYPGTGVGLAICQALIEKHRGRIWVESEKGRGSTFFFTIPL